MIRRIRGHTDGADLIDSAPGPAKDADQGFVPVATQIVVVAAAAADGVDLGLVEASPQGGLGVRIGGKEGEPFLALAKAEQGVGVAELLPASGLNQKLVTKLLPKRARNLSTERVIGPGTEAHGLARIALQPGGGAGAGRTGELGGIHPGVAELGAARRLVQLEGEAAAVDQLADFLGRQGAFIDAQIVQAALEEVVLHVVVQVPAPTEREVGEAPARVEGAVAPGIDGHRAQEVVGVHQGIAHTAALFVAPILLTQIDRAVGVAGAGIPQAQLLAHAPGRSFLMPSVLAKGSLVSFNCR